MKKLRLVLLGLLIWAGSSFTTSALAVEPPPMTVGVEGGNWSQAEAADIRGAVPQVRYDTALGTTALTNFENAGLTLTLLFSGPFNTEGVCALDPSAWANNALQFYKTNTTLTQSPYIEVLEEPGATWFWGSTAPSSTNGACYRTLLQQTYNTFHATYGGSSPKILASVDGSSGLVFGQNWWQASAANYVDGVTVHPFGGTANKTLSALGNRALVEGAHTLTNKPVYVTEVGWPTAVGQPSTGDSFQWTEAEQASNITNFVNWARGTGYVSQVMIFNYRDYGTNQWYGITRPDGTHKPSYDALKAVAGG